MAGEYDVARECVARAMEQANEHASMSEDVMATALLNTLLPLMMRHHTKQDLANLIEFQLEACDEDEFVITRGS